MRYYIGMDVGGSYARMKVANTEGRVLGAFEGQGGTITSASYEIVHDRYRTLIDEALHALNLAPADCAGLCVGASGIDTEALHAQYMQMLEGFGFAHEVIRAYNDGEMLLHLYPDRPCIVIISGTGSIIVGKDRTGRIVRYGGWSYLLSDEGSASYIIRKAIEATLRYWDGYGEGKILADIFREETGLQNQQEAASYFFENVRQKEQISRYAPLVDKAAALGDPTALSILNKAAERLFVGMDVVARQMEVGEDPFVVIPWGSVMTHNEFVAAPLRKLIADAYPNAEIIKLDGEAVDCALAIARAVQPDNTKVQAQ